MAPLIDPQQIEAVAGEGRGNRHPRLGNRRPRWSSSRAGRRPGLGRAEEPWKNLGDGAGGLHGSAGLLRQKTLSVFSVSDEG